MKEKNKEFSDMEQWDVICIRCGKHLFSEQRTSTAGDIHRLHETNDEFYDEIKAAFFFFFSSLFLSSSPTPLCTPSHLLFQTHIYIFFLSPHRCTHALHMSSRLHK